MELSMPLTLLSLCELFGELETAELNQLAPHVEVVRIGGGEVLYRAGDPADSMYTVVSGRLQIFGENPGDGTPRFIGEIERGHIVGEIDLIETQNRLVTVRAARDCVLVKLTRGGFEHFLAIHPPAARKVMNLLAERVGVLVRPPVPPAGLKTITVIPAGPDAPAPGFTAHLCRVLEAYGNVLHLNRDEFEVLFGTGAGFAPGEGVAMWLAELESAYRFVVCEADPVASPWTSLCLRRADRVLAVGRVGSPPHLGEVEHALAQERADRHLAATELVLLHEEEGRVFEGTAAWLAPRGEPRHHHVRLHVPRDMERLGRILAGRAIGLAFGGGGARGCAHIGVIRAIEEAGIPIDMVGGVSVGSIIAALYAMGRDWQSMLRLIRTEMGEKGLRRDITLPLVSLSSGSVLRRAFQTFFGQTAVEDLWLNYFCVSCNLTTSEMVIHDRGPLWRSVSASNALPGILPPVLMDGQLLVDGGILNNQPGDILKERCGGSVIVSSVSPRRDVSVESTLTEMPSPWRVLWSRLNPFEKAISVPSIPATMTRTLMVASNQKSREVERAADYYLRSPIDRFRLDDWSRVEEIAEVGYQYAKAEIAAWIAEGRITPEKPADS